MTYTLSPVLKAVVAFVVGAVVFVGNLVQDGSFDGQDALTLIGWLGGTFGVWATPNKQD